nr:hypothetical protein [Pantoea agglomerans]
MANRIMRGNIPADWI